VQSRPERRRQADEVPKGQTQTQRRRIQIDLIAEEPVVTRGLISDTIHINPGAGNTTTVTTSRLATISTPSVILNTISDGSAALKPIAIIKTTTTPLESAAAAPIHTAAIKNTAAPLGSAALGPAAAVSALAAVVAPHDIPWSATMTRGDVLRYLHRLNDLMQSRP
jgi:hypothetical protein